MDGVEVVPPYSTINIGKGNREKYQHNTTQQSTVYLAVTSDICHEVKHDRPQ